MDLLVIGSVAYDTIETPAGKADRVLGGSATYFSVSASYFTDVHLVGIVGEDFSENDRQVLLGRGIDIQGLETAQGKTFHWKGDYLGDLNEARTHETHLNVFEKFQPRIPDSLKNAPFLFLANIDPILQKEVMSQLVSPRLIACDTMNFWIENSLEELRMVLKEVDLILINEAEVKSLSGCDSIFRGGKEILSWGPDYIIVKRGEYGALLLGQDECFLIPAFPVENVVDPTGAGDSFAGGFMGWLSRTASLANMDLRKAMVYGTVMASFAVEGFSLHRVAKLDMDLIQNRFDQMVSHFRIE